MSVKGQLSTSEALDGSSLVRLLSGLHRDGEYLWEVYCCISFCTALRVSDVRELRWRDILNRRVVCRREKKTGKLRRIPVNEGLRARIAALHALLGSPSGSAPILRNPRTGKVYTTQYINRRLKLFRYRYKLPAAHFSSHSLRKSFGRYVYDSHDRSPESLVLLSSILKHGDPQTTMVYLGIRQDEIDDVYDSLELNY